MDLEEEIFEKQPVKEKKPKKVLSEAQKEALAKGRARVAEKRAAVAAAKVNAVGEKTSVNLKKQALKEKKTKVKEQEILTKLLENEKTAKRLKKLNRFEEVKNAMYEKIECSKTFAKLQSVLEDITEDDIVDDSKLEKLLTQKYRSLLKEE